GRALKVLNRSEEAVTSFGRAIASKPDYLEAYSQRIELLVELRRLSEALGDCDKALLVSPNVASMHQKRADVLFMLGRAEESFAAYDRAYAIDPGLENIEGARLITKMYVCDWTNLDEELKHLVAGVEQNRAVAAPFTFLIADVTPKEQLACARTYAAAKYPASTSPLWNGQKYNHPKIRLGYASGEFRDQATAYLVADLFECHDRSKFELYAIYTGIENKGARRNRIKAAFDSFYDVRSRSDLEIAEIIRRD